MAEKHIAHVADNKKVVVKEFEKLLTEYPIIGVLNMENMPSSALGRMRGKLRSKAVIRMTKRRLMRVAIENVKDKVPGIEKLEKEMVGMPALLFTKDNPFALAKTIQSSRTPAAAKAGQISPKDIIIPAGPTNFAPGPIISELAQVGIKSGIENGKVAIKVDSKVAKKGDVFSEKLASMLMRLGVEPMELGLDLVAVLEKGEVFRKDILTIDDKQYKDNLALAGSWAFNLAIEIAYPSKETTDVLLGKAFNDAKALAISQGILADAVVGDILAKAVGQAKALAAEAKLETS